jgi:hypothetical protein
MASWLMDSRRSSLTPAECAALLEIKARPALPSQLPAHVDRVAVKSLIDRGFVGKKGGALNLTDAGEVCLREILDCGSRHAPF